jgi:hypothetical protein
MQFAEFLGQVIKRLKLPGAAPAADARNLEISLKTGQTISLSLLDDDATCSVSALVGFYPEEAKLRPLFEFLLAVHAFGYGTRGAMFGVDMEASKIFMFRTFPMANIDLDGFTLALHHFIEAHRTWLEAYQSGRLMEIVAQGTAALLGPSASRA